MTSKKPETFLGNYVPAPAMSDDTVTSFASWLTDQGHQILPSGNEWEVLMIRIGGRRGGIYRNGKGKWKWPERIRDLFSEFSATDEPHIEAYEDHGERPNTQLVVGPCMALGFNWFVGVSYVQSDEWREIRMPVGDGTRNEAESARMDVVAGLQDRVDIVLMCSNDRTYQAKCRDLSGWSEPSVSQGGASDV